MTRGDWFDQAMEYVEVDKAAQREAERYIDGTHTTPGSEKCRCSKTCPFPCWQRLGIAPACSACGCPPLPEEDEAA